jgi:phage-related holin
MKNHINNIMQEFGFHSSMDFLSSTFGYLTKPPVLVVSFSFATIGTIVEKFIGLDPVVYLAFIVLLFVEFFTGIRASLKEGKKLYSKRFGRVILKLLVYTTLIGVIHIFKTRLDIPKIYDFEINVYSMIYYAVLNLIVIQLILSVLENLSRLGYKESSKIYKAISNILNRYIKLVTPAEITEEEGKEHLEDKEINGKIH